MNYMTVSEAASVWEVSERSVRNYCAEGRVPDAYLTGKTWNIPTDAQKPERLNKRDDTPKTLLETLRTEKDHRISGGIYHKIMIDLTYNSNHIEGSRLTHDQTRFIFETNTLGATTENVMVDDIVETANHFNCINQVIENANYQLSEAFIKELHKTLKTGTSDSRLTWFRVGDYKKRANIVGGKATCAPAEVPIAMKDLLARYNQTKNKTLDELLDFHYQFERIHPFQDGNGRVGRLILFKECLRNNIVPFIIEDEVKLFYYRGLNEWPTERGYLRDTCLNQQYKMKKDLEYFGIPYEK